MVSVMISVQGKDEARKMLMEMVKEKGFYPRLYVNSQLKSVYFSLLFNIAMQCKGINQIHITNHV